MTERETRRIFFAVWPDAPARVALEAAAGKAERICGGRRMRGDGLHVTLAFVGAVTPERLEMLVTLANDVGAAPYDLELDRLGWWPHNRIVWAGCREMPSGQRRLFESLAASLTAAGFALDSRPHVPHVTLLRNARCHGELELPQAIRWRVDAFSLVESLLQPDGSRYEVLARWPLDESA